jgi:hypothetical protein
MLFGNMKRTATAKAITPCVLYSLSHRDLHGILELNPAMATRIREVAEERLKAHAVGIDIGTLMPKHSPGILVDLTQMSKDQNQSHYDVNTSQRVSRLIKGSSKIWDSRSADVDIPDIPIIVASRADISETEAKVKVDIEVQDTPVILASTPEQKEKYKSKSNLEKIRKSSLMVPSEHGGHSQFKLKKSDIVVPVIEDSVALESLQAEDIKSAIYTAQRRKSAIAFASSQFLDKFAVSNTGDVVKIETETTDLLNNEKEIEIIKKKVFLNLLRAMQIFFLDMLCHPMLLVNHLKG